MPFYDEFILTQRLREFRPAPVKRPGPDLMGRTTLHKGTAISETPARRNSTETITASLGYSQTVASMYLQGLRPF